MSTDAAAPQPGDQAAAGTNAVPEMGFDIPSDGMEVVPEVGSPESGDSAPRQSKDWEKEAKRWQGDHDRLQERFKPVNEALDRYGIDGNQAVALLEKFDQVLNHADLAPVVRDFLQTGQVNLKQSAGSGENDEMDDDDFDKPWLKDLQEIRGELTNLQQENARLKRESGSRAIGSHTQKFLTEYPLNGEEKEQFEQRMEKYISNVRTQEGLTLLQNMTWENFRSIALPMIEEWRDDIAERRRATKRDGLAAMATDAPPKVGTQGVESASSPPVARSKQEVVAMARQRFREAVRQVG